MLFFNVCGAFDSVLRTKFVKLFGRDYFEIVGQKKIKEIVSDKIKMVKEYKLYNNSTNNDNGIFKRAAHTVKRENIVENRRRVCNYSIFFEDRRIYLDVTDLNKEKDLYYIVWIDIITEDGKAKTIEMSPFTYNVSKKKWLDSEIEDVRYNSDAQQSTAEETDSSMTQNSSKSNLISFSSLTFCIYLLTYVCVGSIF
ncbi:hypothetical protein NCER_102241 [Vairimorpha ceranae BRL01]|uniref:Uncharacterized protein n=1 Tax=Vairimorpha ceranae (strain BRL01) TaxID=578460 RepID=C4VBP6_VAIC1|nr:hypothetical protein NCER_102241 [Vairimorpha ceranae BRL01]